MLRTKHLKIDGYESVVSAEDLSTGLKAIVAIHNTRLGPSCGGVRLLPYASQDEALADVLRLSKGMSYKSAVAGLGFGGGKSVIVAEQHQKEPSLFHSFGDFVESFQGRYIAAKDMNITSPDLLAVKARTRHVLGVEGVEGSSGDPSPITAIGCLEGLRAVWEFLSGKGSLSGVRVSIQGLGHVGYDLAKRIVEERGIVLASDIDAQVLERARRELGVQTVSNDQIFDASVDIFSPCARGAVLNPGTTPRLRCRAVVGCANNQLANHSDGLRLWERNIVYAPDFVVNAGGIINIFVEYEGYNPERAIARAKGVFSTMREILQRSRQEQTPAFVIADKMAEKRLYG